MNDIPAPPGTNMKVYPLAAEFGSFCFDMVASHLDAIAGIQMVHDSIVRQQSEIVDQHKGSHPELADIEFADRLKLSHEFDSDASHPFEQLHVGSMGEGKKRTELRGRDALLLGGMLISFLYDAWDHQYRQRFEEALEVDKLQADIFGELRRMRNAVAHNRFVADQKVASAKLLPWFREGDEMFIPAEGGQQVIQQIFLQLDKWCEITMNSDEARAYIEAGQDEEARS